MDYKPTELKIIDTYEEFKKYFLLSSVYLAKYSPEEQEKTIKYFYKQYILVVTKDNYVIELDKNPTISKTLWYDDELDIPKLSEEYFINYNKMHLPHRSMNEYIEEKERLKTDGIASGKYDYNGVYLLNSNNTLKVEFNFYECKPSFKPYFIRYLTQEEEKDLFNIIKEIQGNYINRLKKYYARYKKNIHCSGYWANR